MVLIEPQSENDETVGKCPKRNESSLPFVTCSLVLRTLRIIHFMGNTVSRKVCLGRTGLFLFDKFTGIFQYARQKGIPRVVVEKVGLDLSFPQYNSPKDNPQYSFCHLVNEVFVL